MEYQEVKQFRTIRAIVALKNGTEHFGKICEIGNTELQMEIATETSDRTKISVSLRDIHQILSREHVNFLHPKSVLSKEADAAITRQIETIKKGDEFKIQTRKFQLQVNGSSKRSKWSSREFEKTVAKWLTVKKPLEICPFALVKIKEEEFLLGVDRGHNVRKINQQGISVQ